MVDYWEQSLQNEFFESPTKEPAKGRPRLLAHSKAKGYGMLKGGTEVKYRSISKRDCFVGSEAWHQEKGRHQDYAKEKTMTSLSSSPQLVYRLA